MAIEAGADALGLVGQMPSGPGIISDDLIREIAMSVPPGIATFLLTSETIADSIIGHHQRVQTNTIQLVDHVNKSDLITIKKALPSIKLVQVIHVMDESSVSQAIEVADYVDAVLLDSGNTKLPVKELGGTGRTHDWTLSRKIREALTIPVYLAGGLKPENVKSAIDQVGAFGLDLCSGVRTNGRLDAQKLKSFFSQFRN